jgi:hypothetical protein
MRVVPSAQLFLKEHRQIYCLAISAKRYVLFLRDKRGIPSLLSKKVNNKTDHWSQHGLGHLLNPSDPESEDREWIVQAWLGLVRRALGLRSKKFPFVSYPPSAKQLSAAPPSCAP